jgi:hypothetical protein
MGWLSKLLGGNKGVLGNKEATTVDIHGRALRCQICSHAYFWRHDVMLNTRTATFFSLDWMNRDATCVVCDHCGYMHWFIPPPLNQDNRKDNNA